MRNLRYGLMAVVVVGWTWHAFPLGGAQAEASALGADAAVNVFAHDEAGRPVTNARVRCGFWLVSEKRSPVVFGRTDETGHFLAKARCSVDVLAFVRREGFYWSSVRRRFEDTASDPKVVDGKWQPYGAELPVRMRRIGNPTSLVFHSDMRSIGLPVTNIWVGFDMKAGSLVKPFGTGNVPDLEFFFEWDGKVRRQYAGSSLRVRFPGRLSGGYWFKRERSSEYEFAMSADTNAAYQSEFSFWTRKTANGWCGQAFGTDRSLVVRTRCQTAEDGTLLSATYGQIMSCTFGWGSGGQGWVRLGYEQNPTPNDTNLESDRVIRAMRDAESKMTW